jgi:putative ABC transport system permease protein
MRSLLTSLGVIIGVSAVIVMVANGQGSQAMIEERIGSLGANLIIIFPRAGRVGGVSQQEGSVGRLTMEDVDLLAREATLSSGISPLINVRSQVIAGNNNWNTTVTGVSASYLDIRAWPMQSGNFFSERDVLTRNKVAVLGKTVVDNLFPGQDPIGQLIRIRNTPFIVIGVLSERGQTAGGGNTDDVILAPSTSVLYRLSGERFINTILASAESREVQQQAQNQIQFLLRQSHRLSPNQEDDFEMRSQTEILETITATTRIMTLLLGSIAGVSLVVGGIGIMNIMLVSVTERTREIGIRLAIGARGRDVLTQFLLEAVVLSLVGGFVGILLAFGISAGLNRLFGIPTLVNPFVVLLAVMFSAAVGIFFGFYPARKAAALNPIDALRYE